LYVLDTLCEVKVLIYFSFNSIPNILLSFNAKKVTTHPKAKDNNVTKNKRKITVSKNPENQYIVE